MYKYIMLAAYFADAASPDWIGPILQFGVGGGVLIWFMFRCEPRLKAVESAIDRMARSVLLLVITLGSAPAKEQAQAINREIDEAEARRNPTP